MTPIRFENHLNTVASKKVYAIIVTYNGAKWIIKCITSIYNNQYPTEIIVIDNGSTDETCELISGQFPETNLIKSKKNLGFGQANNIGIKKALEAKADYIFLLNQDAWIKANTIETLVANLERHPIIGMISPIHLNGKGNSYDKYFYDYFIASGSSDFIHSILMEENTKPDLIKSTFVNAAAWLMRAKAVEDTGGFDPLFFHYGEDRNYCQRLLHYGWEIGISTTTAIYHDRDLRLSLQLTPSKLLQKEKIEFLTHAADISRNRYLLWICRRYISYCLNLLISITRNSKQKRSECWNMLLYIPSALGKIQKSRKMNLVKGAHLLPITYN